MNFYFEFGELKLIVYNVPPKCLKLPTLSGQIKKIGSKYDVILGKESTKKILAHPLFTSCDSIKGKDSCKHILASNSQQITTFICFLTEFPEDR